MGEAVQAMWGDVGIRVKFDTVDVSQYTLFRRPPPGRGDVLMVRWGGRPDPLMTFQEAISGKAQPWGAGRSGSRCADRPGARAGAIRPEAGRGDPRNCPGSPQSRSRMSR